MLGLCISQKETVLYITHKCIRILRYRYLPQNSCKFAKLGNLRLEKSLKSPPILCQIPTIIPQMQLFHSTNSHKPQNHKQSNRRHKSKRSPSNWRIYCVYIRPVTILAGTNLSVKCREKPHQQPLKLHKFALDSSQNPPRNRQDPRISQNGGI